MNTEDNGFYINCEAASDFGKRLRSVFGAIQTFEVDPAQVAGGPETSLPSGAEKEGWTYYNLEDTNEAVSRETNVAIAMDFLNSLKKRRLQEKIEMQEEEKCGDAESPHIGTLKPNSDSTVCLTNLEGSSTALSIDADNNTAELRKNETGGSADGDVCCEIVSESNPVIRIPQRRNIKCPSHPVSPETHLDDVVESAVEVETVQTTEDFHAVSRRGRTFQYRSSRNNGNTRRESPQIFRPNGAMDSTKHSCKRGVLCGATNDSNVPMGDKVNA